MAPHAPKTPKTPKAPKTPKTPGSSSKIEKWTDSADRKLLMIIFNKPDAWTNNRRDIAEYLGRTERACEERIKLFRKEYREADIDAIFRPSKVQSGQRPIGLTGAYRVDKAGKIVKPGDQPVTTKPTPRTPKKAPKRRAPTRSPSTDIGKNYHDPALAVEGTSGGDLRADGGMTMDGFSDLPVRVKAERFISPGMDDEY
ncbi:hypothetical protein BJ508DRAFT_359878 [Ascobolus immersus RN42]|uniref:Uncharacterized protein n=1 Tax=Ascobolus immersus RN42 TaxID=1160509 RepID=A0A3N4IEZ9_ASCIM|nr:hypothetical protein BJ508DRAFT_359878 [Ascobolus immersus RN42]